MSEFCEKVKEVIEGFVVMNKLEPIMVSASSTLIKNNIPLGVSLKIEEFNYDDAVFLVLLTHKYHYTDYEIRINVSSLIRESIEVKIWRGFLSRQTKKNRRVFYSDDYIYISLNGLDDILPFFKDYIESHFKR